MNDYEKLIFCLDLDAFFASCEEIRNNSLRKIPIAIGYDLNNRGIVSTANYKSREYGIHSGMPMFQAKKIFPELKIIKPDFNYYTKKSEEFFSILHKEFTNKMEISSVDECYLDLTENVKNGKKPIDLALQIQERIFQKTKLTVSIGISTNKVLAKIASNIEKPNGITTLYTTELKTKLWNLEIDKLPSIGKKTAPFLRIKNIFLIRDFANIKSNSKLYNELKEKIGNRLDDLLDSANGIGDNKINSISTKRLSLSYSKTFPTNLENYDEIKKELFIITKNIVEKMSNSLRTSNTISLQIKYSNSFNMISKTKTLNQKTNDLSTIWTTTLFLFEKLYVLEKKIKLLGVSLSNLKDSQNNGFQTKLDSFSDFSNTNDSYSEKVNDDYSLINDLNDQLGYNALILASDHKNIKHKLGKNKYKVIK